MRWILLALAAGVAAVAVAFGLRKRAANVAAGEAATAETIVRVKIIAFRPNPAYVNYRVVSPADATAKAAIPAEVPYIVGTRDYKISQIPYPTTIDNGIVWASRTGRGGPIDGAPVREVRGGVEKWGVWRRGAGGSAQAAFAAVVIVAAAVGTAVGGPGVGAGIAAGGAAIQAASS